MSSHVHDTCVVYMAPSFIGRPCGNWGVDSSLELWTTCVGEYETKPPVYEEMTCIRRHVLGSCIYDVVLSLMWQLPPLRTQYTNQGDEKISLLFTHKILSRIPLRKLFKIFFLGPKIMIPWPCNIPLLSKRILKFWDPHLYIYLYYTILPPPPLCILCTLMPWIISIFTSR